MAQFHSLNAILNGDKPAVKRQPAAAHKLKMFPTATSEFAQPVALSRACGQPAVTAIT
jgi:hypothetical protein